MFNPLRIKPLYSRTLSVSLYKDDTEINTLDVNNRIYILNINKISNVHNDEQIAKTDLIS